MILRNIFAFNSSEMLKQYFWSSIWTWTN